MNLSGLPIDASWSLFLDRDGVINRRIVDGYVLHKGEFEILPGVLEAIHVFSNLFPRIFIVTNQQGIGKGLMSADDLKNIHQYLLSEIKKMQGRVDKIYYAPNLKSENSPMRKPGIGMALQAKREFPKIDFEKSIMVGDAVSDMEFGKNAGMTTVFIGEKKNSFADFCFPSLSKFADEIKSHNSYKLLTTNN
ncbi:MAG: HAD family hydrolase [Bacteroidota bacterium]